MFRTAASFGLLTALLAIGLLVSIAIGSADIPVGQLLAALRGAEDVGVAEAIVWDLRLPRALMALTVGAGLAATGAAIQGLFRNPLADPSLIGVSGGAALAAAVFVVLGSKLEIESVVWSLPTFAFAGGLVTTYAVMRLGTGFTGTSVSLMLLAGIAINAVAIAGVGVMSYLSSDTELRSITFWALGSLAGADWAQVGYSLLIVLCVVALSLESRALNCIVLGESEARHLGIAVERVKLRVVVYTALAVGIAVAFVGIIAFVGLIVPHLIRLMIGSNHRIVIPGSALLGALLVLVADLLAKTLVMPAELPIGILTSILGGPFFISLIMAEKRRLGLG